MEIKIMDRVLAANDDRAAETREWLRMNGIAMLNLIGSPGAGKTTLLEKTVDILKGAVKIGVIEGDIATAKDAERMQKKGVPVYQINTGTACHLDAHSVAGPIQELCGQHELDLILVENIGNLVCPAEFDIGEYAKIAILSVAEGDDKIEKYPLLFSESKALVISKLALLPHTNFNLDYVAKAYRTINPHAVSFPLDSLTGEGVDQWIAFIKTVAAEPKDKKV